MLSGEQRQHYLTRGFLRIPGVLGGDALALLQSEWSRLWEELDPSHPSVQLRGHGAGGMTADRLECTYLLSPGLHALCSEGALPSLAAELLGAPVILFKDKLISKEPGTHGYGLHQDWPYWVDYGVPAQRIVTLVVALDSSDAQNGAIEVWPTAPDVLPAPDDDPRDVDPAAVDLTLGTLVPLDAGDVMLLHPLAPHRSAANASQRPRRTYLPTYVTAQYASAAERFEAEQRRMLATA